MCGIFGLFSKSDSSRYPALDERVNACSRLLRRRGPDDNYCRRYNLPEAVLYLGHTRLAIIDLSSAGRQPMTTDDGRYTLSFNGEIYNYLELKAELLRTGCAFKSNSDTEVLLQGFSKWGLSCIEKLTGMFAIALYDAHTNRLWLIRDAFGIKPLYYRLDKDWFAFASEISALNSLCPTKPYLNPQMAIGYLLGNPYDQNEATFFQDVLSLQPGHLLELDISQRSDSARPTRWWWPKIDEDKTINFDEAASIVREEFLSSIKLHLRTDVPFGAALSGGLDSSAIACAIRFLEPDIPIHTFSFVPANSRFSEESWIDLVNQRIGAISHKIYSRDLNLLRDIDELVAAQGEPFGSTSIYAQFSVFRDAKRNGIIVTLDGQGADELFAGYNGYPSRRLSSLLHSKEPIKALNFFKAWLREPGRISSHTLLKIFEDISGLSLMTSLRKNPYRNAIRDIGPKISKISSDNRRNNSFTSDRNPLRSLVSQLRADLSGGGLQPLLRHGDRNSMHWSIESRVPFLTTQLAQRVLTFPEHYLVTNSGVTKAVFREAMKGIVPDEILNRKDKIGFIAPERDFLSEINVKDWLPDSLTEQAPFIKIDKLRELVSNDIKNRPRGLSRVWRSINLARWLLATGVETAPTY
jgi:asparagine synthase (glutamine-hydrolysing)